VISKPDPFIIQIVCMIIIGALLMVFAYELTTKKEDED
jgi:uncharacterized membrane protein YqiK